MRQVVPLGTRQQPAPSLDLAPVVTALRDQIADQVEQAVTDRIIAAFTDQMKVIVSRATVPTIHVAAPQIRVDVPTINIPAPVINIEATPVVTVEVPGLRELAAQQAATNQLLTALLNLESRPVLKTVERDGYQNIVRIVETRG